MNTAATSRGPLPVHSSKRRVTFVSGCILIFAILQRTRPKQPVRAKCMVLGVPGGSRSVRNDPTGLEGQLALKRRVFLLLPLGHNRYNRPLGPNRRTSRPHCPFPFSSSTHMHTGRHLLWCAYPRFNHRARACRLTAPAI